MTLDEARACLLQPDVTPQDLADVAAQHPELRAQVASHPLAYPGLLEWIAAQPDPVIDASRERSAATADTRRPGPGGAQAGPVDRQRSRGRGVLVLTLVAAAVVALGGVAAATFALARHGAAPAPLDAAAPRSVTTPGTDEPPLSATRPLTELHLTPAAGDADLSTASWKSADLEVLQRRIGALGIRGQATEDGDQITILLEGTVGDALLQDLIAPKVLGMRPVLYFGGPDASLPDGFAQNMGFASPRKHGPTVSDLVRNVATTVTEDVATDPDDALATDDATAPKEDAAPAGKSSLSQITGILVDEFAHLDCTDPASTATTGTDDPAAPIVACAQDGATKYILGPSEVEGAEITRATAEHGDTAKGYAEDWWYVTVELSATGADQLAATTARLAGLTDYSTWDPSVEADGPDMLAIVLDGVVISAPSVSEAIHGGRLQISGDFTEDSAGALATSLASGQLPVPLDIMTTEVLPAR